MQLAQIEKNYVYEQIHRWCHDPAYRQDKRLNDIIFQGARWGCTLKEYLERFPKDRKFL